MALSRSGRYRIARLDPASVRVGRERGLEQVQLCRIEDRRAAGRAMGANRSVSVGDCVFVGAQQKETCGSRRQLEIGAARAGELAVDRDRLAMERSQVWIERMLDGARVAT